MGEILWVDRYGNCQLNVDPEAVEAWGERVQLRWTRPDPGVRTAVRAATYGELGPSQVGLVVDSYGLLAVSVRNGSAADLLGVDAGDELSLAPLGDGPDDPGPDDRAAGPSAGNGAGTTSPVTLHPREALTRPGTTIVLAILLALILGASAIQPSSRPGSPPGRRPSCKTLGRMNLARLIDDHDADRPALVSSGTVTSYGKLRDLVARARGGLASRGVEPGDRVALVSANSREFVIGYLATLGAGAVAVPLNPQSPEPELRAELARAGVKLALRGPAGDAVRSVDALLGAGLPRQRGRRRPARRRAGAPGRPGRRRPRRAAVHQRDGGCARPAMLTHGNLSSNVDQILANPERPEGTDEVALCVLPLCHVFALNAVLGVTLRVGGTAVLAEQFDARASLAPWRSTGSRS